MLNHSAEMITVNRESHQKRKRIRTCYQGGSDEPPIISSAVFPDSHKPHAVYQSLDIPPFVIQVPASGPGLIFIEKRLYPFIIMLGRIDSIQYLLITVYQGFLLHLRNEVKGKIGIIAGAFVQ